MASAWVVRPYPHGIYRLKEFLDENIVAIGWPSVGDLSGCQTKDDIKNKLKASYKGYCSDPRSLGQAAGIIYRFVFEIQEGDYVVVPDGPHVYIGRITSPYRYNHSFSSEGYSHIREVEWAYDKGAVSKKLLTGRIYDSLKGRQTVYETYYDDIDDVVRNKKQYFSHNYSYKLKKEYLDKLQKGLLRNVNSNTFEDAVCKLYSRFFPGLRRLSTRNSAKGDTDLLTELPGGLTIRIQVKYFYPDQGKLGDWVVDQLALSMQPGDYGVIITSGEISEAAKNKAAAIKDKIITFIDGQEFVDHLFGEIDSMEEEDLEIFGLCHKLCLR